MYELTVYFFSNLPPSQGGRYAGFGSTPVNQSHEEQQSSGKFSVYILPYSFYINGRDACWDI